MRPCPRRRARAAGFTLIELMISLVIFSLAVASILAVAVTMTTGFREQRETIAAEGAARSAMAMLADAVRGTSPGTLSGAIQFAQAPCSIAEPLSVVNSSSGPDEMTLTYAYGSIATTATAAYTPTDGSIAGVDFSQFSDGDSIIVTDSTANVAVLTKIAGTVAATSVPLAAHPCTVTNTMPIGSLVVRAMRARFYIADLDGVPALWMDADADGVAPEPLAEGIEDMQIAYARDRNNDGTISEVGAAADDDEWAGNVVGDSPITTGPYRALRITLIARTAPSAAPRFLRPAAEDRPGSTLEDKFRRRSLRSTIEFRNLQGSP